MIDGGGRGWLAANDIVHTVMLPCTMPDDVLRGVALGVLDSLKRRGYAHLYPEEAFVAAFIERVRLDIPAPAPIVNEAA